MSSPKMSIRAPAKINLCLQVLSERTDGYHNIGSVFQAIDFCDELECVSLEGGEIRFTCDREGLSGPDNMVWRAAVMLRDEYAPRRAAALHLNKRIPAGAGLGGGSSDGAAALYALNELWGLGLTAQKLSSMGARLGADVPFFFYQGAALVEGKGELITPCPGLSCWVVLVKPAFSVSTAWAYKTLKTSPNWGLTRGENYIKIPMLLRANSGIGEVAGLLCNDFEPLVVREYPLILDIKGELYAAGAAGALMSGSGSSVFGLFARESVARAAVARLKKFMLKGGEVYLARTLGKVWG